MHGYLSLDLCPRLCRSIVFLSSPRIFIFITTLTISVTSTSKGVCSTCNFGVKLSAENGRIASVVAEETGCGTPDCPWIIEAKPGQKVNISLTDFALARQDGTKMDRPSRGPGSCRVYATIKEESVSRSTTVCGGSGRERHIYTSVTNTVEIRIVGQPSTDDGRDHFLLKYEGKQVK